MIRKSDETGGGDIQDPLTAKFAGRWAGDQICLIGDYDSSHLYQIAVDSYTNIAEGLVAEYNQFIGIESLKLDYTPSGD